MSSKFWKELSNDYEKLFEAEIGYDVIIYAGEEPNVKEIHAHSNILCIRKPNIPSHLFDIILRFIYIQLLELLVKRDDLNIDEIEIWEGLLKWCLSQQNMENDPTKWSKDDITKIERSLHRFIPLIRFYDIKSIDFFYKVYNYKNILPQDLIHDLLEFHIVPNMKPKTNVAPSRKPNLKFKLNSTLIQSNHTPLFASWIDRKDSSHYDNNNVPYDFKLLYHSGRDGFDAASFHKNCDNKGATIWIAKIQGSSQLVGGYNPLDWSGNDVWKTTRDSFLFSFADGKNISTAKLGYVKNPNKAIYCSNNQGPHMGDFFCNNNNDWINYDTQGTHYPNIAIAFSNEWAEKKDGKFILKKPNISPHLFDIILRFIYSGNIELKNLQGPDVLKLNCDNKGATIWVAKFQGSTQLIGGYNPLDWNGYGFKYTADSFLFNFTDGNNISTAKLGYVKKPNNAIFCSNDQGPHMGIFLCYGNNEWKNHDNNATYYPDIGIPNTLNTPNFAVENYEVFQVVIK
ncbi:hypothetical protein GLOIN_2v1478619 [Rhizophagus irregularis DAOM 181602=DAOM 197198]|nr:hypothetical protein GLOIN_2v1478619 [Rhizophagus irregularis DAOM 181602=DAOM 197198]